MNHSNIYNTHHFIKQLTDQKFIPEQAEAIVKLVMDIKEHDQHLFMKKSEFSSEFSSIKHELQQMELRMIIKLGCMIASSLGVIKLFLI